MMNLNTDIRFLKGVGQRRAEQLATLGIDTIGALLRFYPRGYEDFRNILSIEECPMDQKVCIKAKITTPITEHKIRKNMTIYRFSAMDKSGNVSVTIFNNKYLAAKLHTGSEYLFLGKLTGNPFMPSMSSPEIKEVGACGIHPIYHAGGGITSSALSKYVRTALSCDLSEDPLPEGIRTKNNLCDLKTAIENIHFPKSEQALEVAKKRLVFEELFILQTGLMLLKGKNRLKTASVIKDNCLDEFCTALPFSLTRAQLRAANDCISDMMSGKAMNRLVQGDVGSGKTAVAAALMFVAAKNGFQSALMAPTEILAEQHFATISSMFEGSNIKIALIMGSTSKAKKSKLKEQIKNGEFDVVIGTHALLTEDTEFRSLGLVITDEQHRFGVNQRAKLAAKGEKPHTLVMSATPIPRTLALIIYGDLDISIIDEYPKGRQKIQSYCVTSDYRPRVYGYIKKHLDEGRQGYIVCPLVDENEDLPIISAQEYYEKLSSGAFKDYSLGLLHGKMPAKEKDRIMRAFKDGEIKLLISTTVIEVGIDVPNAAIMVIENAERFGLSQLHQLRGRIGRGSFLSSCIFISDMTHGVTSERLNVIKNSTDGFKIADEDLRLRGPGDFLGNRQHGLPQLKIADISADSNTLRLAGMAAANLLEADPKLKAPENLALRQEIIALYKKLNEN